MRRLRALGRKFLGNSLEPGGEALLQSKRVMAGPLGIVFAHDRRAGKLFPGQFARQAVEYTLCARRILLMGTGQVFVAQRRIHA